MGQPTEGSTLRQHGFGRVSFNAWSLRPALKLRWRKLLLRLVSGRNSSAKSLKRNGSELILVDFFTENCRDGEQSRPSLPSKSFLAAQRKDHCVGGFPVFQLFSGLFRWTDKTTMGDINNCSQHYSSDHGSSRRPLASGSLNFSSGKRKGSFSVRVEEEIVRKSFENQF